MNKHYPDFVIIGAMKSGSTSLYQLLNQCEQICFSETKEPGFFSRDERYELGIDKYLDQYQAADPKQITGEASTCYSRKLEFPHAAERLHSHNPGCKLVYVMRDPVSRAYSDYAHRMSERLAEGESSVLSYKDALHEIPAILDASDYLVQIEHYLKYFRKEQLYLVTFEKLASETQDEVLKLFTFLGVQTDPSTVTLSHQNEKGAKIANRKTYDKLDSFRKFFPSELKQLIPEKKRAALREAIFNRLSKSYQASAKNTLESKISERSKACDELVRSQIQGSWQVLESNFGVDISDWPKT